MSSNLKRFNDDIPRLAASLSSLESQVFALQQRTTPAPDQSTPLQRAKEYIHKRRSRERMFGSTELFADPAWNILIDLFIASEERKAISVSSACIASSVPTATALRWIKLLENDGHVSRVDDRSDVRLSLLYLSEAATDKLRRYFSD